MTPLPIKTYTFKFPTAATHSLSCVWLPVTKCSTRCQCGAILHAEPPPAAPPSMSRSACTMWATVCDDVLWNLRIRLALQYFQSEVGVMNDCGLSDTQHWLLDFTAKLKVRKVSQPFTASFGFIQHCLLCARLVRCSDVCQICSVSDPSAWGFILKGTLDWVRLTLLWGQPSHAMRVVVS